MTTQTPELNYKRLNYEQLLQLVELDMQYDLEKQTDALKAIRKKLVFIGAKKGKGKTGTAVGLSWWLREQFGDPVVCVGTKMGLGQGAGGPDAFGSFSYLSEFDFRDELEKIDLVSNEEQNASNVASIFERHGIKIIGSTVVFDEANKLMNSRTPQDKMVKLTVQFMSQIRHYDCTGIVLAPDEIMIDKLIRPQFDWKGQAFWNKYTGTITTRLQYGIDVITFEVDLLDGSVHTPFGYMYKTNNILGFRATSLNIKKL